MLNAQDEMLADTARQATFFFFKQGFIDYLAQYREETGEREEKLILTWVDTLHVVTRYCADWSEEKEKEAEQLNKLFAYVENAVNTCIIVNGLEPSDHDTDVWASTTAVATKNILIALCQWSTSRSTSWNYLDLVASLENLELADLGF